VKIRKFRFFLNLIIQLKKTGFRANIFWGILIYTSSAMLLGLFSNAIATWRKVGFQRFLLNTTACRACPEQSRSKRNRMTPKPRRVFIPNTLLVGLITFRFGTFKPNIN